MLRSIGKQSGESVESVRKKTDCHLSQNHDDTVGELNNCVNHCLFI